MPRSRRAPRRGTARLVAAAMLGAACGGARGQAIKGTAPVRAELLPEDQAFAAKEIEIHGIAFAPEALDRPAMPRVTVRGHPTLEGQRRKVERSRPDPRDVQVLVGFLWDEAAKVAEADPARADGLREQAAAALRNLRAMAPDKADAVMLQMLAAAEMWRGNHAAASAAFEELLARFPESQPQDAFKAWLAYLYVRQHRLSDAAKLTGDWDPDQLSDMGAYALAWVAFISGQAERARRAITTAAATWKDPVSVPAVEHDLVFILARTGTDLAEAIRLVAQAAGGDLQRRYTSMFELSEAYKYAGDYDAASRALDRIVDEAAAGAGTAPPGSAPGTMPAYDLVGFHYRQADYAFRLNRPGEAAERAIQAYDDLAACAARCTEETAHAVIERILKLAQFSHTVYARSLDGAHYDAALALYQHYLSIPGRPDADAARGYLSSLQETRATADPAAGKHGEDVLLNFVGARREVMAACYEWALLVEPALEGGVRLSLEIDDRGTVSGATTDTGAGSQGMAKVAGCVVERVRPWTFPSRTVPGKTVLVAPLAFRRQPAPPAAPAPPASG